MNQKINPKTLKGNESYKRTLDLMDKLTPLNESTINASLEFVKRGPDDLTYVIIRENRKYFIKTTKEIEFKVEDLSYIGGLQNKLQESYTSYEDALKHLNLTFHDLNERYEIKNGLNLFEQDYFDIEDVDEDFGGKKYKLKLPNSGANSNPTPAPSFNDQESNDVAPEPEMESPEIEDVPADNEFGDSSPENDMDYEDDDSEDIDDEEDPVKYIQKLTGKLGQKIRELTDIDPKLEKYVINSIISALHIDKMDKKDRMDVIRKFKKKNGSQSDMGESMDSDESFHSKSFKGPFNYNTAMAGHQKSNHHRENDRENDRENEIRSELKNRRDEKWKDLDSIFQNISQEKLDTISKNNDSPTIKEPIVKPKTPFKPKRPSPFRPNTPKINPKPKADIDELEKRFELSRKMKKSDFGK